MKTVTLTWEQYSQFESTVMGLSLKLERAVCMIENLAEGYFCQILTPDNLWKLEADFDRNKIITDIAFDYVYDSKQLVEQIETMTQYILISGKENCSNE